LFAIICPLFVLPFGPALAAVTISSGQTQNMDCSDGVCSPTAVDAVLNVTDLENFLASGNLEITTTGNGVQASEIDVTVPFSWSTGSLFSLDAYDSIAIESQISVEGEGGLSLLTDDGGTGGLLSFKSGGDVTFADLSSQLTVNGRSFSLAGDVASLAIGIAANPTGNFALAKSYDASGDGTYDQSPIPTRFGGSFEGLGNTISNLTIQNSIGVKLGFFATVLHGNLAHIGLVNESISSSVKAKDVGGLVGYAEKSTIDEAYTTGAISLNDRASAGGLIGRTNTIHVSRSFSEVNITAAFGGVGGLIGTSDIGDKISLSYATGAVKVGKNSSAGGLLALMNEGTVIQCFATGNVSVGPNSPVGGLVGDAGSKIISDSYATGNTTVADRIHSGAAGGLVGNNVGEITTSYAIGVVSQNAMSAGGLIGVDGSSSGSLEKNYWDTTTSGITNPDQGAGNILNDPGITGKTTKQFRSRLPKGFSPKIWGENSNINGGLPYLLANPPTQ
jgi:hypothetical protein